MRRGWEEVAVGTGQVTLYDRVRASERQSVSQGGFTMDTIQRQALLTETLKLHKTRIFVQVFAIQLAPHFSHGTNSSCPRGGRWR